jgi:hypothetical protein
MHELLKKIISSRRVLFHGVSYLVNYLLVMCVSFTETNLHSDFGHIWSVNKQITSKVKINW